MKSLQGACIYITGGSSGIGLAFAKLAASKGAHIAIIARDTKKLEQAKKEIQSVCVNSDQKVDAFSIDVCNAKKLYKAVPTMIKKFGNPDFLVCAAGVGLSNYFEKIMDDDFKKIMDINVFGIWYTLKAFYPYLKNRNTHCVLLSSLAGLIGVYTYSAYGTSKFAVFGLADCLRSEFKENGIVLSVICPPEVDTPFLQEELKTIPVKAKRIKKITGVLSADTIAKKMVGAIQNNKYMVVPGAMSKITWVIHRMFNGYGTRIIT
ncbi:MAG: SDR family oxidoreductase, partial [Spirochaetes bacterium]|nr:SDR family oxidoreductase [Spirochaetota bacterium]